jgi:hypothetical protein
MILEIIGYISTALILISFMFSGETRIRVLNLFGCIAQGTYSAFMHAYPIVLLNSALILIHVFHLFIKPRLKNKKS